MSDTAAFFAKKKKGKKFKSFNANKIDVSTVTPTTHVDAPEVSEKALGDLKIGDDQWADNTSSWGAANNNGGVGADSKVAELLDMQTLMKSEDDVAERLRIEETKAQLARAKEGMAKEAERLEREKKEKEEKAANRKMGLAASMGEGTGGKWVPSHLRGGGTAIRGPATMDGVKQPNVTDDELFPDLASADKILAEKEKQEKAEQEKLAKQSQGIRAPTGWGARMGSSSAGTGQRQPLNLAARTGEEPAQRKPLNLAPPSKKEEEAESAAPVPVAEEKSKEEVKTEETAAPVAAEVEPETAAPAAATAAPKKEIVLKKKKKKDLSSFKASS
jgi:hypothetical protein